MTSIEYFRELGREFLYGCIDPPDENKPDASEDYKKDNEEVKDASAESSQPESVEQPGALEQEKGSSFSSVVIISGDDGDIKAVLSTYTQLEDTPSHRKDRVYRLQTQELKEGVVVRFPFEPHPFEVLEPYQSGATILDCDGYRWVSYDGMTWIKLDVDIEFNDDKDVECRLMTPEEVRDELLTLCGGFDDEKKPKRARRRKTKRNSCSRKPRKVKPRVQKENVKTVQNSETPTVGQTMSLSELTFIGFNVDMKTMTEQ